jgi:thiosulfate reductase cytochrome b subunit
MMMGKFDIYNMLGVNQWLTQIFIFLFVVTVTFIVVNMLLSILNDTFSAVRNDKAKQQNDYEIVDFMLGR